MVFTDVTSSANILHEYYNVALDAHGDIENGLIAGGAVAEDFDGDGWIDLFVLQGGGSPDHLYMNQGDGTFVDEASSRGAAVTGRHMGVCAADYDNDGDVDIFISSFPGPHHLLINSGSGTFTRNSTMVTLPSVSSSSPSFGDLDNDGHLELALGSTQDLVGPKEEDLFQFYKNTGGGQLTEHFYFENERDFIPLFLDYDNDHYQDMFAVADFLHTRWYRNDGTGLLLEEGRSDIDNGMGGTYGDIDNDGDLDVFMTSIAGWKTDTQTWNPTGNRLMLNNGNGTFTDITESSGTRDGDWAWGTDMADFDNDGDLDIYLVNGWPVGGAEWVYTPARLFENLGNNTFDEIAGSSGAADDDGQGRSVAVFDYDNDGDLDIFICNNSDPEINVGEPGNPFIYHAAAPVLLRNDTVNNNNWIKVQLAGNGSPHHSHGIGSRVYVSSGGIEQMRELNATSRFNGHGPARIAHFGLNEESTVNRIRAVWTNGDETEMINVAANQEVVIGSPQASISAKQVNPGGSVTATYPEEEIPTGYSVSWIIDGVQHSNPAAASLSHPGDYAFTALISPDQGTEGNAWTETYWVTAAGAVVDHRSVAQIWNEQNLSAIRIDFPDPTQHARNLLGSSIAMWDAWAAYDSEAVGVLYNEEASAGNIEAARHEAISYAAYRVLLNRYNESRNSSITSIILTNQMQSLGYDPTISSTVGDSPSALGNRIAETVLSFTAGDYSEDPGAFLGGIYAAMNDPLQVVERGTVMTEPNHWQPLEFDEAFTQNEQEADLIQSFLGPHWGIVQPFALQTLRDGQILHVDPGTPPLLGTATDQEFKDGSLDVVWYSSLLDPDNTEMIDISPGAIGNNTLGYNDGTGYPVNPATGSPYPPNIVKHADFGRVLAEFWADGPDSETPPGHWNTLANELHEHPHFVRRYLGEGGPMDRLEWDVKLYLALNGALHDAAIVAWGCKRVYDYVRPISSIRYMGGLGQSSNPGGPSYHQDGLPLVDDLVEVITSASTQPGQHHEHLLEHVGKVSIRTWSVGQEEVPGGVDWMLAEDWLPYQRATFVTPAFPGYVSGHSTFSRAAAEVLTLMTGDTYFPGGLGTFHAGHNDFLQFEEGPTTDITLQWATYYDAADQAGISRLYGGIHVPADDGPGRIMGSQTGINAWNLAVKYFDGSILEEAIIPDVRAVGNGDLELSWSATRGLYYKVRKSSEMNTDSFTDATGWTQATTTKESIIVSPTGDEYYRIHVSSQLPE